jgi:hypothetical protein
VAILQTFAPNLEHCRADPTLLAEPFLPVPDQNWCNELKILFTN